jgi:cytoplasmic iron level regulating protein YaaA (DUF328/UPF0246 family)
MNKIVLIACAKSKAKNRVQAQYLYQSILFKKNLAYARSLKPDKIYIISALHGLLDLETPVDPYDLSLNDMSDQQRKAWSEKVISQILLHHDPASDHFVFLAGLNYRKYLVQKIKNFSVPLEGLSIGRQLQTLLKRS